MTEKLEEFYENVFGVEDEEENAFDAELAEGRAAVGTSRARSSSRVEQVQRAVERSANARSWKVSRITYSGGAAGSKTTKRVEELDWDGRVGKSDLQDFHRAQLKLQQAIEKKKTNYSFRIWQAGRRGAAYLLRNLMNEELKEAEATVTVEFEQSLVSIKMPAGEPKPKGFNMYAELENMLENMMAKNNPNLAELEKTKQTASATAALDKMKEKKMVTGDEVLKMLGFESTDTLGRRHLGLEVDKKTGDIFVTSVRDNSQATRLADKAGTLGCVHTKWVLKRIVFHKADLEAGYFSKDDKVSATEGRYHDSSGTKGGHIANVLWWGETPNRGTENWGSRPLRQRSLGRRQPARRSQRRAEQARTERCGRGRHRQCQIVRSE